jgi:hypothetical protein
MRAELVGLKGGKKQLWLRLNRKQVDAFYLEHGPDATRAEYGLTGNTLERYLDRSRHDSIVNKLSQADKWILEIARAGDAEVRGRVRDLEDWREQVQPVIDVGRSLINATMRNIEAKVSNPPLPAGMSRAEQLSGKSEK